MTEGHFNSLIHTTIGKLQVRRGNRLDLPNPLDNGEFGWADDTKQLYIGNGVANQNTFIGGAAAATDYNIYLATTALGGSALADGATGLMIEDGTTTSTSAGKLVNGNATFTSAILGKTVYNTTDSTWAKINSVDSATQLTLSVDIMASGETYEIVDAVDDLEDAYSIVPSLYTVNITILASPGTFTYAGSVTLGGKGASGAVVLKLQGVATETTIASTTTTTLTFGDVITVDDISFSHSVVFSSNVITSDCTYGTNLTTSGTLTGTTLTITGNLITVGVATLTTSDIGGNLTSTGAITLNATNVTGNVLANGAFTNTTSITIGGTLTVYGTCTLATASITGHTVCYATITNTTSLSITGNFTTNGVASLVDVNVGGNLTINAEFDCTTDLDVTGDITTNAKATIAGSITCANITTGGGTLTQTGSLTVTTDALFNGEVVIEDISVGGTLTSNSKFTESTDLDVTGNATFNGETVLDGTLTVGGNFVLTGTLTQTGSLSITGTLETSDVAYMDDITVGGEADFAGKLYLTGTNIFNGEVYARDRFEVDNTTFNKNVYAEFGCDGVWDTCTITSPYKLYIQSSATANTIISSTLTIANDPTGIVNISSTITIGYTFYVATTALGGDDATATGLEIFSSSATSTSANKLVDTGASFTEAEHLGKTVYNSTDDTWAEITAVDSATQLSLDADIMASGEAYKIVDAFSTIQKAINEVPGQFNCDTTIKISNGTFTENLVLAGKKPAGVFTLYIIGTMTTDVSATQESAVQGGGATQGSITDTGMFTGHANKLLYSSNNAEWRVIDSVTANTATIVGTWTAAPTGTYKVLNWATIIDGTSSKALNILPGQTSFFLDRLHITTAGNVNATLNDRVVFVQGGVSGEIYRCKFTNTASSGAGWNFVSFAGASIEFRYNYVYCVNAGMGGINSLMSQWLVRASKFLGNPGGVAFTGQQSFLVFVWGSIIDNFDGTAGISLSGNAFAQCYTADFNIIRNCASYGVYARSGAQASSVSTTYFTFASNGTNYAANATEFSYIVTA